MLGRFVRPDRARPGGGNTGRATKNGAAVRPISRNGYTAPFRAGPRGLRARRFRGLVEARRTPPRGRPKARPYPPECASVPKPGNGSVRGTGAVRHVVQTASGGIRRTAGAQHLVDAVPAFGRSGSRRAGALGKPVGPVRGCGTAGGSEGFRTVRLQPECVPNAPDRGLCKAALPGHRAGRPVGGVGRGRMKRSPDDVRHPVVPDSPRAPRRDPSRMRRSGTCCRSRAGECGRICRG